MIVGADADALRAFLALAGAGGSVLQDVTLQYGLAAPRPEPEVVEALLHDVAVVDDDAVPQRAYKYCVVRERGRTFSIVLLAVQDVDSDWDSATGRRVWSATITLGAALGPKMGKITPGRAWDLLRPWYATVKSMRQRQTQRRRVIWWARDDGATDRVRFDRQHLDSMLAALRAGGSA